jgi:hypothetical protein
MERLDGYFLNHQLFLNFVLYFQIERGECSFVSKVVRAQVNILLINFFKIEI